MRLGIHTSIADSLEQAAIEAAGLGANTFQIFSSSPRMWKASAPDPGQIQLLRAARERLDLNPLAIHANYLVNLASVDPVIRARSIAGFRGELERASAIGADFLVLHPGSFRGRSVEEGIETLVAGLLEAARGFQAPGLTVLFENTAGAGCHIGSLFEELRDIRNLAAGQTDLPIGFCLDTCHLLAAGYDISTAAGLRSTVARATDILGLANVHLFHANDSKGALGSHVDRHANIGDGQIGADAFRRILTHPQLSGKPFILETPVEEEGDDRRNLDRLKSLAVPRRRASPLPRLLPPKAAGTPSPAECPASPARSAGRRTP